MNPIEINIDYKYPKIEQIEMVQGDVKPFEIMLTDNYEDVNLQGYTVSLNMIKPDDTFIIQTSGFVIDKNKIKFTSMKDFSREPGIAKMQVLVKNNSYENFTWEIKVKIIPAVISEDTVPSENIIPVIEDLNEAIRKAQEWLENHPDITELDNKVNSNTIKITTIEEDISSVKTDLSSNIIKTDNNELEIGKIKIENSNQQIAINKVTGLQVEGTTLKLNNKLIADTSVNYLWNPGADAGYTMSSNHKVTMKKSINDTIKGIVLIWSAYTAGVMRDYNYMCTPIFKDNLLLDKNQRVVLSTTGSIFVTKQISISSDGLIITGHDSNTQTPNDGMALRRIIEF